MKIDLRVSELADPEIWHFPLTLLVVLTTLSHYRVRCDNRRLKQMDSSPLNAARGAGTPVWFGGKAAVGGLEDQV